MRVLPGHQSLLNPIQTLSPSPDHRPTLAPIQVQSRRLQARTHIVHGHARENEMRSVGGHEDAASHANHLVIESAVAVQGVDTALMPQISAFEGDATSIYPVWGFPVSYVRYSIISNRSLHSIRGTVCQDNREANRGRLARVYRSDSRRHEHTASDALVFIINATMSLRRSNFQ